ncbi:Aste57867_14010 [Aphanomyces stellatus]|uniref:Elicitin n=1 Tax=Aphanomyces stellatus TaxID=120398 RepID=A0A485L086_9STRA|nr:hypothetical protein As57867_013959 [Aphanomyces stellatus]VFT90840.1 Aste57867_14010 [Aphanomyces stellatus]
MKFASAAVVASVAALLSATTSADKCTILGFVPVVTPLGNDPNLATCKTESGYDFITSALSGTPPTAAQVTAISGSTACTSLYATLGTLIATINPPCTLGNVSSANFSSVPIPTALNLIFSTLDLSSLGGSATTTKAPSTTAAPATPKPNTASSNAAISLALVGAAIYGLAN